MAYFNQVAATAWLDLHGFGARGSRQAWLVHQLARLGHEAPAPPHGYYLFVRGELRAYHSGRLDLDHDARAVGIGVLAFLLGIAADEPALRHGGVAAAHAGAAMRVIAAFSSILESRQGPASREPRASARREAPPRREPPRSQPAEPLRDDIALAFEVLGIPIDATQAAVKSRYRALAKEWHPDRFVSDHARAGDAAVRMTQINVAYTAICQARGWT